MCYILNSIYLLLPTDDLTPNGPPRSILLHPNLPHPAQPQCTCETDQNHHGKQGPEDRAISIHQSLGRRLVDLLRAVRDRFSDDLSDRQPDRGAQLRTRVEHGAAQCLGAGGKHRGDDEQTDGE